MKRSTLVNLHLYFSGVSLFLLLLFITSGSLHLFGVDEGESKKSVALFPVEKPMNKEELEKLFTDKLAEIDPSYRFDYFKGRETSLMTRPTTRTYYRIEYNKEQQFAEITKHSPNLNKRLMELHKGHGPQKTRKILAFIAMIFATAILTGLWLGLSVKKYRKITLLTSLSSLLIVLVLFNL